MVASITRDDLHELIDELPESTWAAAGHLLQALRITSTASLDDEPLTEEDLAAIAEAQTAIANGEDISTEEAIRLLRSQS
jgi:hypothetical protein